MDSTARQARLMPEFAALYPPLTADLWEPAAEMGARVLLWQVQQKGTAALGMRLLDERHFEFRGGWSRGKTRSCAPGCATRPSTGRCDVSWELGAGRVIASGLLASTALSALWRTPPILAGGSIAFAIRPA